MTWGSQSILIFIIERDSKGYKVICVHKKELFTSLSHSLMVSCRSHRLMVSCRSHRLMVSCRSHTLMVSCRSHTLMVSCCYSWMSIMCLTSSTICFKEYLPISNYLLDIHQILLWPSSIIVQMVQSDAYT